MTYRQTVLLCALVLAGWAWDLALGGSHAHAWAWLAALVLVGGVSALAVRSARRYPPPAAEPSPRPDLDRAHDLRSAPDAARILAIRTATPDDLIALPEIELAANRLFELAGYGSRSAAATVEELRSAATVLVAGSPPVGFVRVDVFEGEAHIAQVAVRPRLMRGGVGTALVAAAMDWAADAGYPTLKVRAFADVPWNEPFFAAVGFSVIDIADGRIAMGTVTRRLGDSTP